MAKGRERSSDDEARDGAMVTQFATDMSHLAANMEMYARWIKGPTCDDQSQLFEAANQIRQISRKLRYGELETAVEKGGG